MRRREFIAGLGSAVAWPLAAGAQADRVRRVGVLMDVSETDPFAAAELLTFKRGLADLGWIDGQNIRMDVRWAAADVDRMRALAKELVALQPDVILSYATPVTAAVQRETRTIPIVFVTVADPIGPGFVASLARPGGNITGFVNIEASIVGKFVELLTQIAPGLKRLAIVFNPDTAPNRGSYFLPFFEAATRSSKLMPIVAPVHSDAEIETTINSLGREPGSGLIAMPDGFMILHRAPVISLAARNNVPAIYSMSISPREGGLMSYGPDQTDILRRSASYVDRILRGAKTAELPVQLPIKFEMVLNLKTAKALGIAVPQTLLVAADEVIE